MKYDDKVYYTLADLFGSIVLCLPVEIGERGMIFVRKNHQYRIAVTLWKLVEPTLK